MSAKDDQQRLRDAYYAKQQEIKEAAERIYQARGQDLVARAAARDSSPLPDPEQHEAAAKEIAQILAERGVRTGNFDFRDYRDVPEKGVLRAEEKQSVQQQEAEHEIEQTKEPQPARIYENLNREHAGLAPYTQRGDQEPAQPPRPGERPLNFYEDLNREHAEAREKGGLNFFEDRNPSKDPGLEH